MNGKVKRKSKKLKLTLIILAVIIVTILTFRVINGMRFPSNEEVLGSYVLGGDMDAYQLEQEGVTVTPIKDNYINGFHIVPDEKSKPGLIVSFGGSDGGIDFDKSIALAKEGYEVVPLFYFGQENQPESYNNVPLEFFGEFLEWAKASNVDTSPLTLIGISKGSELALVLASRYEEISNVVLYAPSSYVFQGGDMLAKTSSWTYEDKELPYINLLPGFGGVVKLYAPMIVNYPISFRDFQYDMIHKDDNPEAALIDVSNFKGNILALAGGDDQVWPSDIMGQMIKDAVPEQTEFIIYPDAGHAFASAVNILGMANGGTVEGNKEAQINSDAKLNEFLTNHHK